MIEQMTLGAAVEHVTEVIQDDETTPPWPWFYWRCSCGAGRRAMWDGIYGDRSVAEARAADHLAEAGCVTCGACRALIGGAQ